MYTLKFMEIKFKLPIYILSISKQIEIILICWVYTCNESLTWKYRSWEINNITELGPNPSQ